MGSVTNMPQPGPRLVAHMETTITYMPWQGSVEVRLLIHRTGYKDQSLIRIIPMEKFFSETLFDLVWNDMGEEVQRFSREINP